MRSRGPCQRFLDCAGLPAPKTVTLDAFPAGIMVAIFSIARKHKFEGGSSRDGLKMFASGPESGHWHVDANSICFMSSRVVGGLLACVEGHAELAPQSISLHEALQ